ncbi:MAG TPA: hypothetical protein VGH22_21395, partial [Candidatus Binatia bacterium]
AHAPRDADKFSNQIDRHAFASVRRGLSLRKEKVKMQGTWMRWSKSFAFVWTKRVRALRIGN